MTAARGELNLTVQDKIRLHLESYGIKDIPITVEELATRVKLSKTSAYQAIHRLKQNREIDIEKEADGDKEKIVGIKLIKLQPSGRTYRRAADRSGKVIRLSPSQIPAEQRESINGIPALEATTEYLNKKLAVEEMRAKALSAGLDESVIQFETNPLGEEAILLLKLYTELKTEFEEISRERDLLSFDVEAEKRNNEFLKNKLRQETEEDLRGMVN